MAKRLLLDALIKVLGEYVELNEDNLDLSLAVWSGKIELSNLKLKTQKLFRNLNVSVFNGSINSLEVIIPWTALLNSPVKVLIDGVFLQVGPLNIAAMDKDDTRKRLLENKLTRLKMSEKFFDSHDGSKPGLLSDAADSKITEKNTNSSSYVQYWTSRIADNIEITIKNLHFRYEDVQTIPGVIFAAGITLDSLALVTCDDTWIENFVARKPNQPNASIRKMMRVRNVSLYWDVRCESTTRAEHKDWVNVMRSFVCAYQELQRSGSVKKGGQGGLGSGEVADDKRRGQGGESVDSSVRRHSQLLSVPNALTIRAVHNEGIFDKDIPKFDVSIECTELALTVERAQYCQLLHTVKVLSATEKRRQPALSYRPNIRPKTRRGAYLWWRYATRLVRMRGKYVRLFKKMRAIEMEANAGWVSTEEVSSVERSEMKELEEFVPLSALIIFRQIALREMQQERELLEGKSDKSGVGVPGGQAGGRTWWGLLTGQSVGALPASASTGSGAASSEEEDDISVEQIMLKLDKEYAALSHGTGTDASATTATFCRFELVTSFSLEMLNYGGSVAKAFIAAKYSGHVLNDMSFAFSCDITDILVEDCFTVTPAIRHVVRVRKDVYPGFESTQAASATTRPAFFIGLGKSREGKFSLKVAALPIEVSLNKLCVRQLARIFALPPALRVEKNKGGNSSKDHASRGANGQSDVSVDDNPQVGAGRRRRSFSPVLARMRQSMTQPFDAAADGSSSAISSSSGATATVGMASEHAAADGGFLFEVSVEMHAPKLIVPENSSSDSGYLLLDAGYLHISGFVGDKKKDSNRGDESGKGGNKGISWRVELRDVNAGLPLTAIDMYQSLAEKSLYLIKPFDISLSLHDKDASDSDLSLDVDVGPEIRGELDAKKLARLLVAISEISATFSSRGDYGGDFAPAFVTSDGTSHSVGMLSAAAVVSGVDREVSMESISLAAPSFMSKHLPVSSSSVLGDSMYASCALLTADLPRMTQQSVTSSPASAQSQQPQLFSVEEGKYQGTDDFLDDRNLQDVVQALTLMSPDVLHTPLRHPRGRTAAALSQFLSPPQVWTDVLLPELGAPTGVILGESTIQPENENPLRVGVKICMRVPVIVLDLMYQQQQGGDRERDSGQRRVAQSDHHLVLSMSKMECAFEMRPYDFQIAFDLGEVSIKDSMRCAAQRELAWTPRESSTGLIHITYKSMNNRLSPYYRSHGTEVDVQFANLGLNCDANTLMHLRPFIEVLMSRKRGATSHPGTSPSLAPSLSSGDINTIPSSSMSGISDGPTTATFRPQQSQVTDSASLSYSSSGLTSTDATPTGMLIECKLSNISLDLLRTSEHAGEPHDKAFLLQITGLTTSIDLKGLMKADVRIRSVDIIDTRDLSADYVFKKVVCPLAAGMLPFEASSLSSTKASSVTHSSAAGVASEGAKMRLGSSSSLRRVSVSSSASSMTRAQASSRSHSDLGVTCSLPGSREQILGSSGNSSCKLASVSVDSGSDRDLPEVEQDLLHITYNQESKNLSFIGVQVVNVTSFVALDTILDLVNVASANFFAFLNLLASPNVPENASNDNIEVEEPKKPHEVLVSEIEQNLKLLSTSTMNVTVTVSNPRLIILDDPTSAESRAIICQCGSEIHYTREARNFDDRRDLHDSLHSTLKNVEVFVLLNMLSWQNAHPILEPFGIDFHLRRMCIGNTVASTVISLDMDGIRARVSLDDMLLAQSIMMRRALSSAEPPHDVSKGNTHSKVSPSKARAEATQQPQGSSSASSSDAATLSEKSDNDTQHSSTGSAIKMSLNIGSVQLVIVNDFNGQNFPLFKTLLDHTRFYAEGHRGRLRGEGSLTMCVDFYNSRLAVWEPVLDQWHPELGIFSYENSVSYEIRSVHTMQVTVSGLMLQNMLQTYSLLLQLDDARERDILPEITINNLLGEDIVIYDSLSGERLLALDGIDSAALPILTQVSTEASPSRLASAVDVFFTDPFGSDKLPLLHLPFNLYKPRACHLRYREAAAATSVKDAVSGLRDYSETPLVTDAEIDSEFTAMKSDMTHTASTSQVVRPSHVGVLALEPIVEEAYENCRYDHMTGYWRPPFLMGDPAEWTDVTGSMTREISAIRLPSQRWDWLDAWTVDMRGLVGYEIDNEGWEYGATFSSLCEADASKALLVLDACRRRRWIRTRAPRTSTAVASTATATVTASGQGAMPCENVDGIVSLTPRLTIFWDSQHLSSGARKVDIRSRLQVSNKMPFPIEILLHHFLWSPPSKLYGPILEGEIFSVPLQAASASLIRVRPAVEEKTATLFAWGRWVPCNEETFDFSVNRDITCPVFSPSEQGPEERDDEEGDGDSNERQEEKRSAADTTQRSRYSHCMRMSAKHRDNSLLISVEPYVTITNLLPCQLRYRCSLNDYDESPVVFDDSSDEEGALSAGATRKLTRVNLARQPYLSFKVGNFGWSQFTRIDSGEAAEPSHILFYSNSGHLVLVLNMLCTSEKGFEIDVVVFSKAIAIDRTGLKISLSSQYKQQMDLIRNTFQLGDDSQVRTRDEIVGVSEGAGGTTGGAFHVSVVDHHGLIMVGNASSASASFSHASSYGNLNESLGSDAFAPQQMSPDKARIRGGSRTLEEERTSSSGADARGLIADFITESARSYILSTANVGELVYSDDTLRWTYLPPQMRQQLCIRTSVKDAHSKSKDLMRFTAAHACIVLVLVDMSVKNVPHWLKEGGFTSIVQHGIARKISKSGAVDVRHYAIRGKFFGPDERVTLGGNYSQDAKAMYAAIVLSARELCDDSPDSLLWSTFSPIRSYKPQVMSAELDAPDYSEDSVVRDALRDSLIHGDGEYSHTEILESFDRIFEQVTYNRRYDRALADRSWVEGCNGVALFHADNDTLSLGIQGGASWSNDISINMSHDSSTGSFEIIDWADFRAYQLSYISSSMPGIFGRTQQLVIVPTYCIVNCLDEPLYITQVGSHEVQRIDSFHSDSWHKSHTVLGTNIQIRTLSSLWSLGSIDISRIGSTALHLARHADLTARTLYETGQPSKARPIIVHIEVKLAEPTENCAMTVVIWQSTVEGGMAFSIKNDSDVCVTVKQANLTHEILGARPYLYDLLIEPGTCTPFGWVDPDAGDDVLVTAGRGDGVLQTRRHVATMSLVRAGARLRLPDSSGRSGPQGELLLSVLAEKGGKVLRVTRHQTEFFPPNFESDPSSEARRNSRAGDEYSVGILSPPPLKRSFSVSFFLGSLGVSLVLDKPIRREFFSLYVDELEGRFKVKGATTSYEFIVTDLQLDNYSESCVYQVLLYSPAKETHRISADEIPRDGSGDRSRRAFPPNTLDDNDDDMHATTAIATKPNEAPLLQLAVVQELPDGASTPIFKYLAFRMLPLALEVDTATLQLLYYDLIADLKILSPTQAIARSAPTHWVDTFNRVTLSPHHNVQLADVFRAQRAAQTNKMFFEKLVIHPMKFYVTLVQSPFPRKIGNQTFGSYSMDILTSLAGIDRMQLKLKSFEVDDAMESRQSLLQHIANQVKQDLQNQLGQIAGSLAVLGSPLGFARKIGHGVKAFFYEPYQGLVHSPQDFVIGIGKGTSSLLSDVLTGAMNSTVAFVGTASKGISYLSGDSDFIRKRELKRQQTRANRGGIVEGIMDGSHSLVSGFASGFTGLVTKPLQEAQKSGVSGFFRGIGMGLIGAALKPVLGLTDGITSVASGIQNQVDDSLPCSRVRPARALERSEADATERIIVPLHLDAAYAQEFVVKRARARQYEDAFMGYIPMGERHSGEAIILSEVYLYWRKDRMLWGRTWSNISHCRFFEDSVGVLLFGGVDGSPEVVIIPCGSRATALSVYRALEKAAYKMGNPGMLISSELLASSSSSLHQFSSIDNKTTFSSLSSIPHRHSSAVSHDGADATPRDSVSNEMEMKDLTQVRLQLISADGEVDGHRFGSINNKKMPAITGPEGDVLKRAEAHIRAGFASWEALDEKVRRIVWEWDCTHSGIQSSRCCVTALINRSCSPVQIAKVSLYCGKGITLLGSPATGYDSESSAVSAGGGVVVILAWAYAASPLEIGHVKASLHSSAFSLTISTVQTEAICVGKGGFNIGFLEKTVNEWWSKYVLQIT